MEVLFNWQMNASALDISFDISYALEVAASRFSLSKSLAAALEPSRQMLVTETCCFPFLCHGQWLHIGLTAIPAA